MVFKNIICLIALVCASQCNPLGQTTLCEHIPNMLPTPSTTTVCESTPNVLGYGFGLGSLGLNLLPFPNAPPFGLAPLAPMSGSTTVCESTPNIGLPTPLNPLLAMYDQSNYYPFPNPNLPVPSTTVCESAPNVFGLPGLPLLGGLPFGLPRPGYPLGLPLPLIGGMPGLTMPIL